MNNNTKTAKTTKTSATKRTYMMTAEALAYVKGHGEGLVTDVKWYYGERSVKSAYEELMRKVALTAIKDMDLTLKEFREMVAECPHRTNLIMDMALKGYDFNEVSVAINIIKGRPHDVSKRWLRNHPKGKGVGDRD